MEKYIEQKYLACERLWIYLMLMMSGGIMGAYTYTLKGGVFCNAQTGNVLLFGMALGSKDWSKAAYLLIPISAYLLGAFFSEILPVYVRRTGLRWDTLLIAIEILVVVILGFLPDDTPIQVSQVSINFICSMQYNTFRQAQGIPMATTFCTNHIRQTGIHLALWVRKRDTKALKRCLRHLEMLLAFIIGACLSRIGCDVIGNKVIWASVLPLSIVFIVFLFADKVKEKDQLTQKPHGH